MGRIVINQSEEKQVIILDTSAEGVSGGYYDQNGDWTDLGGTALDDFLQAMLTRSDHKDLEIEIKEGTSLYLSGIYAGNVTVTGTITTIANNATLSSFITGVISLPTLEVIGTSCWDDSTINAKVLYCPKVRSIGSNFANGANKPNLVKLVWGTASPFPQSAAMKGSTALKALVFPNESVTPFGNTTGFEASGIYLNADGYIYVPASQIDAYKAATGWSTYQAKFRTIEDYPLINAPTEWLPE